MSTPQERAVATLQLIVDVLDDLFSHPTPDTDEEIVQLYYNACAILIDGVQVIYKQSGVLRQDIKELT